MLRRGGEGREKDFVNKFIHASIANHYDSDGLGSFMQMHTETAII
jgi:hypothetical protein